MSLIKLEPFENVAPTGVAVLNTDRLWPYTCEYLQLTLGGGAFTKAMLTNLKIRFGTKVVWDLSGAQLNSLNLFEVRPQAVTVLTIPFYNVRARDISQMYVGAPDFAALGVRRVTVEATITGATTPTLTARASVVPPGLLAAGANRLFRALLRTPLSPAAAVQQQPQMINYGQAGGALLRKLHFFSALVTSISIKRDGLDYFEDVPLAENNAQLDEQGWDPQANIYSVNFIPEDNELKALTSIRDDGAGGSLVPQQILMTTSGAGAFDVISDVLIPLNGIA